MTVHSSASRFPFDALLSFGSVAGAVSAGSPNPLSLDILSSYWDTNADANSMQFAVVVTVASIVGGTAPTVSFSLQVDTDPAFTSPAAVTIGSVSPTAAGTYSILVSREQIEAALTTLGVALPTGVNPVAAVAAYLQVASTLGGTANATVAWSAYASPLVG